MLTCQEATRLIAHAVDGAAAPRALDPLRQHLALCDRCREEFETQFDVRRVLSSRGEDALPLGFGERLAARLAAEPAPRKASAFSPGQAPWEYTDDVWPAGGPPFIAPQETSGDTRLDGLPWRTWSLRLLPLAAVLLIFVIRENFRDAEQRRAFAPDVSSSAIEEVVAPASSAAPTGVAPEAAASHQSAAASTQPASTPTKGSTQGERALAPRQPAATVATSGGDASSSEATSASAAGAKAGSAIAAAPANAVAAPANAVAGTAPSVTPDRPAQPGSPAPANAAVTPAPLLAAPQLLEPVVPTQLAGVVAQELGLSDAQRKQIEAIYNAQRNVRAEILDRTRERFERQRRDTDAAIERILTPEQRRQYRELNGSAASGIRGTAGSSGDVPRQPLPSQPPAPRLDPTPPPPLLR